MKTTITIDNAAAGRMHRAKLLCRVFNLIASEHVALAALAALGAVSFFCAVAGWPRACAACAGAALPALVRSLSADADTICKEGGEL